MGSREVIRRLPYEIFNKIQRKLTELTNFEIWCIYESTWDDLIDKHSNIRYFRNNNSEEDSIRICELFSKGVDLMIGPDSGLTNMAICFNIKQLWMETRDRPEMTIPPEQLHLLHIYRKKKPICLQNCRARTHARMFGEDLLDHLKYIPNCKNTVQELECFKDTQSHCLDFDDIEIDELFNMIKNITTE